MERALISEFENNVERLLKILSAANISEATEVVKLYMDIRGYGPVKDEAVNEVRTKIDAYAIMQA